MTNYLLINNFGSCLDMSLAVHDIQKHDCSCFNSTLTMKMLVSVVLVVIIYSADSEGKLEYHCLKIRIFLQPWTYCCVRLLFIGSVILSGPGRTLSCPGSSVQYSCEVSPAVNSITWSLTCPDQHTITYSVGRNQNDIHNCSGVDGSRVSFVMSLTFQFHSISSIVTAESNLSISALDTSYLVNSFMSLRVDCEDSGNYKFLDVTGQSLHCMA